MSLKRGGFRGLNKYLNPFYIAVLGRERKIVFICWRLVLVFRIECQGHASCWGVLMMCLSSVMVTVCMWGFEL